MTNHDEDQDMWTRIGEGYNPPVETPRDEIWARVAQRIDFDEASSAGSPANPAIDLEAARRRRSAWGVGGRLHRAAGFAVAAAALVVMGVGIGRMTAPPNPVAEAPAVTPATGGTAGNGLAARATLGRTEALLTMVRADARDGRVDPAVTEWADDLLTETRLLLDRPQGVDPELRSLLLDLELVLVQVAGMTAMDGDDERARTEVELTLKSLDQGEVLPRIQAQLPPVLSGA
ncbi:MAG: hypothetical protein R3253_11390 [Longimicrobiales bacterium]|nr:hypothetical protein [Longimicrobiales bacterium]